MTIFKTQNYDMFTFRKDNREIKAGKDNGLIESHVLYIMEQIKKNPEGLRYKPILVTDKLEIIDGQHRCEATKRLNVPLYYEIKKDFKPEDIILFNSQKSWKNADYFNYYISNGFGEYKKLQDFMSRNKMALDTVLNLALGVTNQKRVEFLEGRFVFLTTDLDGDYDKVKQTCAIIKKNTGAQGFIKATKFWRVLIKMFMQPGFKWDKWERNLNRLSSKMTAKTSEKEYRKTVVEIYNYNTKVGFIMKEDDLA